MRCLAKFYVPSLPRPHILEARVKYAKTKLVPKLRQAVRNPSLPPQGEVEKKLSKTIREFFRPPLPGGTERLRRFYPGQ